jgi:hypothetical protein
MTPWTGDQPRTTNKGKTTNSLGFMWVRIDPVKALFTLYWIQTWLIFSKSALLCIISLIYICGLFNDAFSSSGCRASNDRMINGKLIEKDMEGSDCGLTSRCYLGIVLVRLRKTTKNVSLDDWSLRRDLNPTSPEYEVGSLTTWPWRSVVYCSYL